MAQSGVRLEARSLRISLATANSSGARLEDSRLAMAGVVQGPLQMELLESPGPASGDSVDVSPVSGVFVATAVRVATAV